MSSLIPTVVLQAGTKPLADPELWARIKAYQFDKPGVEMPFSERLGDENGWPSSFALEVIEEYRRFVYLACTTGEEVTPSDEVDQAWHLHLVYSRSYWEEFCKNVLRRPLHHGPTEGGPAEQRRYEANYIRTLKRYREAFGSDGPPMHIWPPPQIRFSPESRFARVNLGLFQIAPRKPRRGKITTWLIRIGFLGCALALVVDLSDRSYSSIIPLAFLCFMTLMLWVEFAPTKNVLPRKFKKQRQGTLCQEQHGYLISFTLTYGLVSGVEALAISDAAVTGGGSDGDSDGDGGGGCDGGCGGCSAD